MVKKFALLDVDGCMYAFRGDDGHFTPYRTNAREADEAWAVKVTGRPVEELRIFREQNAPTIGMDRALLQFITNHSNREYTIKDLADHRCGPHGYRPEEILPPNEKLVECLAKIKEAGYQPVIVTDNPVSIRAARKLGVGTDLIPDDLCFDPVKMGMFKNEEYLTKVLEFLGVEPEDAAMFGDSERSDMMPARAVGMEAYFCEGPRELMKALFTFAHVRETEVPQVKI